MISETYCCAKHKIYTHNFAPNTISSHLHRFSNKRPPWMGGAYWKGALIRGRRLLNFFFSRGGRLLEGALKRGWALNRGFTVCIYVYTTFHLHSAILDY